MSGNGVDAEVGLRRSSDESWSVIEHLVRLFRLHGADEPSLMSALCAEAVDLLEHVQHAGVVLAVARPHLDIVAASAAPPLPLNALPQRLGDRPCLLAAASQAVVHVIDVRADHRWPVFLDAAAAAGVASMLCVPMRVDERTVGTLSLYCDGVLTESARTERVARVLAVLAAITLSETRGRAHLETALRSRDLIGQAKGILMYAHRVTADEAFALLVRQSQQTNTKLVAVAETVVRTGTLTPR